jgi:hypothetical protein
MMIAILVIGYVLLLRHFDQKNREKDRQSRGIIAFAGPADYASPKKDLATVSERLAAIENSYQELGRRFGGLA